MTEEKWNATVEAMEKASEHIRAELAAMRAEIAEARAITERLMGYFKSDQCEEVTRLEVPRGQESGGRGQASAENDQSDLSDSPDLSDDSTSNN